MLQSASSFKKIGIVAGILVVIDLVLIFFYFNLKKANITPSQQIILDKKEVQQEDLSLRGPDTENYYTEYKDEKDGLTKAGFIALVNSVERVGDDNYLALRLGYEGNENNSDIRAYLGKENNTVSFGRREKDNNGKYALVFENLEVKELLHYLSLGFPIEAKIVIPLQVDTSVYENLISQGRCGQECEGKMEAVKTYLNTNQFLAELIKRGQTPSSSLTIGPIIQFELVNHEDE